MADTFNILYLTVNENITSEENGVSKKLAVKIEAIQRICTGSILLNANLSTEHQEIKLLFKNSTFISIEIGVKLLSKHYLNKIRQDKFFYNKLAVFIETSGLLKDRIIFRYPFASLGLLLFASKFKNKIVFEHNTKEVEELKMEINSKCYANFSLRPSRLFFWYEEKVHPIYCEKVISKRIFRLAHSGACVTSEIAKYESQRSKQYKTFVSSNFYNVSSARLSGSSYARNGELLTLGIIVTTTAAWYGLDRLFESFVNVKDKYKIIIAGIDRNESKMHDLLKKNDIQKNVEFLGKIGKEELISFYNRVHVCLGSLGLYKINLNYASTLKVKESVSFGIPVVTAYNEEDFVNNKAFEQFYLKIPNDESLLDFSRIEEFVFAFYAKPENKNALRSLAFKYLDTDVKIKALISQIKSTSVN